MPHSKSVNATEYQKNMKHRETRKPDASGARRPNRPKACRMYARRAETAMRARFTTAWPRSGTSKL